MNHTQFTKLIETIVKDEWVEKMAAIDILATKFPTSRTVAALCSLLESTDASIRNAAALGLRDIGDYSAFSSLVKAINKPENFNHDGTLVYALEGLDCSNDFLAIFKIAIHGSFEARFGAIDILSEQEFSITPLEFVLAKKLFNKDKFILIEPEQNYLEEYLQEMEQWLCS